MSPARDLPARPSLDSLRKQAKRLARDAAAGNGEAIARVHAQLPGASHRVLGVIWAIRDAVGFDTSKSLRDTPSQRA